MAKSFKFRILVYSAAISLFGLFAEGYPQTQGMQPKNNYPGLQPQIQNMLKKDFMGESQSQNRKIQKGDILEIFVYNHPELSQTTRVQSDGTVDCPMVSNIPIDGLYLSEFNGILTAQVSKYLGEQPVITVQFFQALAVNVVVLGQVNMPGEYMVSKNATVLGAVAMAGGFTPRAQLDKIKLVRQSPDNKKQDLTFINLDDFYSKGDNKLLPILQEGDVIVVPGYPGAHDIKVIGEVKNPGNYTIFQGATLIDALFMAGGPTENASMNRIRIVSPSSQTGKEIHVDLEGILHRDMYAVVPEIHAGDIIFVPKKSNFFKSLFEFTKGFTSIAAPIAMIFYYTNLIKH